MADTSSNAKPAEASAAISLRILGMTAALLLAYMAIFWVQSGYSFTVRKAEREINAMPTEFAGAWKGKDEKIASDVSDFVGASSQVSRVYSNPNGSQATVYCAVWADESIANDVTPHHPEICYPNAGWKIANQQIVTVKTDHGPLPVSVCQLERAGSAIVLAYWYQMGDLTYRSRSEGREVFGAYWRQAEWPPLVKVLIQVPGNSISDVTPQIEQIATGVDSWVWGIR